MLSLPPLPAAVGIHEAGHFFAAVSRGIHVTKFAIGFGPTIFTYQVGEVIAHPLLTCVCASARVLFVIIAPDLVASTTTGATACMLRTWAAKAGACACSYNQWLSRWPSAAFFTIFPPSSSALRPLAHAKELDAHTLNATPPHPLLQGKEVEYSLRALPLGGFVAFPDDDPESTYPRECWTYHSVSAVGVV